MTGTTWMLILSVLLVSVGISYSGMKKMSKPLPKYVKPEMTASVPRSAESGSIITTDKKKKGELRNWDVLWKESLFKDDRTEAEPTTGSSEETTGEAEAINTEFELVGIARMGRKDASTPVAIILEMKNNNRNRANNRNMGPGRRQPGPGMNTPNRFNDRFNPPTPPNQPNQSDASQNPENRKANKSLYRIGDKIASTDYVVKDIIMEEDKVILERNGVQTVLILDEKNTNSSIRRERVKNEEMASRAKIAQKAQRADEKPATPATENKPATDTPAAMPPKNTMPMRPGLQPGQRNLQAVQQNPTAGMPPLPPSLPGESNGMNRGANSRTATDSNGNATGSPMRRRITPFPQRMAE